MYVCVCRSLPRLQRFYCWIKRPFFHLTNTWWIRLEFCITMVKLLIGFWESVFFRLKPLCINWVVRVCKARVIENVLSVTRWRPVGWCRKGDRPTTQLPLILLSVQWPWLPQPRPPRLGRLLLQPWFASSLLCVAMLRGPTFRRSHPPQAAPFPTL